jgi:hypothetical protein
MSIPSFFKAQFAFLGNSYMASVNSSVTCQAFSLLLPDIISYNTSQLGLFQCIFGFNILLSRLLIE